MLHAHELFLHEFSIIFFFEVFLNGVVVINGEQAVLSALFQFCADCLKELLSVSVHFKRLLHPRVLDNLINCNPFFLVKTNHFLDEIFQWLRKWGLPLALPIILFFFVVHFPFLRFAIKHLLHEVPEFKVLLLNNEPVESIPRIRSCIFNNCLARDEVQKSKAQSEHINFTAIVVLLLLWANSRELWSHVASSTHVGVMFVDNETVCGNEPKVSKLDIAKVVKHYVVRF